MECQWSRFVENNFMIDNFNYELFKKKACICIPTLNRLDYLLPTLINYARNMPDVKILVYDNGKQNIKKALEAISEFIPEIKLKSILVFGGKGENFCVAKSWNILISYAFKIGMEFVLVLNDDVFLNWDTHSYFSYCYHMLSDGSLFFKCYENYDMAAFLMRKGCWDKVGDFDENFVPAYYEDVDYMYRMRLAGVDCIEIPSLTPDVFQRSKTIEAMQGDVGKRLEMSKKYYKSKWGGDKGHEKFKTPFNEAQ